MPPQGQQGWGPPPWAGQAGQAGWSGQAGWASQPGWGPPPWAAGPAGWGAAPPPGYGPAAGNPWTPPPGWGAPPPGWGAPPPNAGPAPHEAGAASGIFSILGNTPGVGNLLKDDFTRGLVVGAGAMFLLTNPKVQERAITTLLQLWSMVQGGMAEMQERFRDAEAEMHQESNGDTPSGDRT